MNKVYEIMNREEVLNVDKELNKDITEAEAILWNDLSRIYRDYAVETITELELMRGPVTEEALIYRIETAIGKLQAVINHIEGR